jgi:7 transmembrane receptor (rhodopsin family)
MVACSAPWRADCGDHTEWSLHNEDGDSTFDDSATGADASGVQQTVTTLAPDSQRTDDEIVVPTVWGFIMALGLFGNLLVAYVMVRFADRSATNCFVVNLALTDLAFTVVVIPLTMIHYVLPSWNLGAACCRFLMYTIYVSMLTDL